MLSTTYAMVHMEGVLRFLLGREDWRDCLDISDRGFWFSFTALIWAAPIQIWVFMSEPSILASVADAQGQTYVMPDIGDYVLVGMSRYLLGWALFPIVMYYLVQMLEAADQYVPYIIVSNWVSLALTILILVPQTVLVNVGLIGPGFWVLSEVVFFGFQIWLLWFIARNALQIAGGQAAAVVVVDLILVLILIPGFVNAFYG